MWELGFVIQKIYLHVRSGFFLQLKSSWFFFCQKFIGSVCKSGSLPFFAVFCSAGSFIFPA